ncbi:hypothetical protein H4R27_006734, partial [Coemansia aciculifera]
SGHTGSRSNRVVSGKDLSKERRAEMYTHDVEDHIVNDSIRELTRPADAMLKLLVKQITDEVAEDMEARLGRAKSGDDKENSSAAPGTKPRMRS